MNPPAITKDPTQDVNPAKNELNGKVPTRTQCTNCTTPVININPIYASINWSLFDVSICVMLVSIVLSKMAIDCTERSVKSRPSLEWPLGATNDNLLLK